jgi:hypothetical protein
MLSRLGRSLTLRNQSAKTDNNGDPVRDDHGNIEWDSITTTDVTGEIVFRGTPEFERRADGVDSNIDVVAFFDDSETVTDGSDDEATRATRIDDNGVRYVVRETFDEDNGLIRAHGERED